MLLFSCVVYACFAGSGVAHAHGETQDEEGGGSAGPGTRFWSSSGSLKLEDRVWVRLRESASCCLCFCRCGHHIVYSVVDSEILLSVILFNQVFMYLCIFGVSVVKAVPTVKSVCVSEFSSVIDQVSLFSCTLDYFKQLTKGKNIIFFQREQNTCLHVELCPNFKSCIVTSHWAIFWAAKGLLISE